MESVPLLDRAGRRRRRDRRPSFARGHRRALAGGTVSPLAAIRSPHLRPLFLIMGGQFSPHRSCSDRSAHHHQRVKNACGWRALLQSDASGRSSQLTFYLDRLREMRMLSSSTPVGAPDGSRSYKHRVSDGFIRLWFRFVFSNQEGIQEGHSPRDLWDGGVEPYLTAPTALTLGSHRP